MSQEDPIKAQLQKRLDYLEGCLRDEALYTLWKKAEERTRECAALRRLCREASEYVNTGRIVIRKKLEAAANGEEVLDDGKSRGRGRDVRPND